MEPESFATKKTITIEDTFVDSSTFRHTSIDHLGRSKVPPEDNGIKYFLIQLISPEGVLNCNVRGINIIGGYHTQEEATAAAKWFQHNDEAGMYFDILCAERSLWYPIDPNVLAIQKQIYHNDEDQKIIDGLTKNQKQTLNELVGRKKEEFGMEVTDHRDRVKLAKDFMKISKGCVESTAPIVNQPGSYEEMIKARLMKLAGSEK